MMALINGKKNCFYLVESEHDVIVMYNYKTPSFSQTNQYLKYSRYSNLNRNVNTFSKKIKSKQKEITFFIY